MPGSDYSTVDINKTFGYGHLGSAGYPETKIRLANTGDKSLVKLVFAGLRSTHEAVMTLLMHWGGPLSHKASFITQLTASINDHPDWRIKPSADEHHLRPSTADQYRRHQML